MWSKRGQYTCGFLFCLPSQCLLILVPFPSLLSTLPSPFPLQFTCWGNKQVICSVVFLVVRIFVSTSSWCLQEHVENLGMYFWVFSFRFEFYLVLIFFFFFFWSGKLSRTSFWRTELVLCVTCGSQTCCVSWHGLKCFQINCRSVQHHKVPHKNQGFCFSSFSSVRRCRCPGLLWRCPKCSDERWRHPPGRVSELPQTPSSPLEAFWEGWQGVRALPRHSSSRFCLHGLP